MVHSQPAFFAGAPSGNQFGNNVALDGEWLAVGDTLDNYISNGTVAVRLGSVHMYRREVTGWELKQYILPPILPLVGEYTPPLGNYISIDGNRMALGGITDHINGHAGTVWVYEFNGTDWVITDRIDPAISGPNQFFGFGVHLAGDDLYALHPGGGFRDPQNTQFSSGAVKRYNRSTQGWGLVETTLPQSLMPQPRLCGAMSVGIDVMVTRCAETANALDPYLRVYEGGAGAWVETAIIPGVDYPGGIMGYAHGLAVWEEWIAVGIPLLSWTPFSPVNRPGQVFLYRRSATGVWTLFQEIEASNSWFGLIPGIGVGQTDQFGISVDFNEDGDLVVGARQGSNALGDRLRGQAYLFQFDGTSWTETRRFTGSQLEDPNFTVGSWFGTSVTADGAYVAVGDPLGSLTSSPSSLRVGRAYVYETGIGQTTCPGEPSTFGVGAVLDARGSDLAHTGVIDFSGALLAPNSLALLIAGSQGGFTAHPGGSAGNSCIGGSVVVRLSTGDGPSSFFGNWTGSIELPEAGSPGTFNVLPGSTWHFQLWFRQPGNPPTSNFSAGLAVTFD